MANPFDKFRIYQFPPAADQGVFACFVSAAREKGAERALAMLSDDEAAEFGAITDQCRAPWWDPDQLWDDAKKRTAGIFDPDAVKAVLGPAAHAA